MINKGQEKDTFVAVLVNIVRIIPGFLIGTFRHFYNNIQYRKYFYQFKIRPDDIFIASYMKSGTTWMQMILYQLTTNGRINFGHIYDISPFFEEGRFKKLSYDHLPSPRFFKTHALQKHIPSNWNVKFIYVMRDGMDVAVSQYYHFIPFYLRSLTFDLSFRKNFLDKPFKNGWFGHLADWLRNKKKFDILYIRYEDLANDLEDCLRKIISFCDLKVDQKGFPRILEKCSFDYMKQFESKFDARNMAGRKFTNFLRKGKVGDGKSYFNKNQLAVYEKKFNRILKEFNLESYEIKNKG